MEGGQQPRPALSDFKVLLAQRAARANAVRAAKKSYEASAMLQNIPYPISVFMKEYYPIYRIQNFTRCYSNFGRTCRERWNLMSDMEKAPYTARAKIIKLNQMLRIVRCHNNLRERGESGWSIGIDFSDFVEGSACPWLFCFDEDGNEIPLLLPPVERVSEGDEIDGLHEYIRRDVWWRQDRIIRMH